MIHFAAYVIVGVAFECIIGPTAQQCIVEHKSFRLPRHSSPPWWTCCVRCPASGATQGVCDSNPGAHVVQGRGTGTAGSARYMQSGQHWLDRRDREEWRAARLRIRLESHRSADVAIPLRSESAERDFMKWLPSGALGNRIVNWEGCFRARV